MKGIFKDKNAALRKPQEEETPSQKSPKGVLLCEGGKDMAWGEQLAQDQQRALGQVRRALET